MKHHRLGVPVVLLALAGIVANACGTERTVGSRFVKSERVAASKGTAITVSDAEEPELAGTRLEVPPGALSADTTVTLELGLTSITESSRGPVAIWGPAGTVFSSPVRMTLPLAMASSSELGLIEIQVEEADGRRFTIPNSALTIDASGKAVSFTVTGFTRFQPGVPSRDGGTGAGGGTANTAGGTALGGGTASAGGTAQTSCSSSTQCARSETCVMRNPGALGVCVAQSTGGGSAGGGAVSGGGTASAGGTASGGGTAQTSCTNSTQCARGETCVTRTPGTVGVCVPPNTAGGSAGGGTASGGGSSGTGGGTPTCGTCPTGQTCWGGACQLIACDPVRGCPSPLSCVANSCQ